jgi:DNA-binding transcriptional LysR family regulator
MDAADLRIFEAVARLGSMNRAAQELHTVQSNVTTRIRALEDGLGIALFQRHARGVTLTAAGQRMLPFAGRIAKLLAEAQAAAQDEGEPSGALKVGSLETTAALRLSALLTTFATSYPHVRLAVTTGTTAQLVTEVVECRLDGAFVAAPIEHPQLVQEPIFREELVLVTERSVRAPRDLAGVDGLKTIVFRAGCSYRQRLDSVLAQMGIVVAHLPRGTVAPAVREGRVAIHAVAPKIGAVDTLFVRRRDAYESSAMRAFLDVARAQAMPPAQAAE